MGRASLFCVGVIGLTTVLWTALGMTASAGGEGTTPELVPVADVRVKVTDRGPVVLLQAEGRTIPIFVDMTVAGSIQGALSGISLPRPLSHDLMHAIMEASGVRVTRTVISLKGGTYYGALSVEFDGQEQVFDSRSSDSIALAIHFRAPILVVRELLESAGRPGAGDGMPEDAKQEL